MIELYFSATPNGLKVRLFLEEAGLPYRIVPVRLSAGEQFAPAFAGISPNNRIPAIVDHAPADGGAPLAMFESGAILLYLAEKCGRLLPADSRGRLEALQWLFWQVAGLGPMAGQAGYFRVHAATPVADAIERYTRELRRLYGVLDRRLEGRSWIAGDAYTIADIACYPWIVPHHGLGQDIDSHPNVRRWFDRIAERPATKARMRRRGGRVLPPVRALRGCTQGALRTGCIDHEVRLMAMSICETCGTQYAETPVPPARCPVCEDDRQYVGWQGQTWTTHEALRAQYSLRLEDDEGVLGIGTSPAFAINQRAIFLPTDAGNILWECLSVVTDEAVDALRARGGLDYIIISHPHFYSSMIEWSEAFGGVPILLHEADRDWVRRRSARIEFWSGDTRKLSDDVTLLRCGGHFPGSTAIHWKRGPRSGGGLFPGDALQVVFDRRHVTFMYSYPNYVPMKPSDVRRIRTLLEGCEFEDVYGYTWGRNIIGGGRAAVDASFDRYLKAVSG